MLQAVCVPGSASPSSHPPLAARTPPPRRSRAAQLLTWVLPWSQAPWAGWNPWQIASHVQRGGRLQVPPAHQLPGPDAPAVAAAGRLDAYCALMRDCWAQEPADRPSFAGVAARLR